MYQIMSNGTPLQRTPDGHLQNLYDWTVDVCREMAKQEGLSLTHEHWEILDVMRQYYETYNISPIYKLLRKEIAEKLSAEKATDDYLTSLFPGGVMSQGIRLAGIPKPMLDAELETPAHLHAAHAAKSPSDFRTFEFKGRQYQVYAKGNLVHLEDWNEELAQHMASKEGITLSEAHWEVIRFLRKFYFQYGISPMVRLLMKHMHQQLGAEKSSEDYLYKLFPEGPARQGSRIAGLPEPQGCIDP